jgi:hypothetical protein
MRIEIPSYITAHTKVSGFGSKDISENSIIIDDNGVEFLIGEDARSQSWDSTRMHGGHFAVPQYRNLVRALVAKTLGEGEHETTLALAASHLWIDEIRENSRSVLFKAEQRELLRSTISDIKFKTSVDSEWKRCRVTLTEEPKVYHELAAVTFVIPKEKYRNFILWQLGHGDLQQIVFVDGQPVLDTIMRTEGLNYAIKNLGEILGITNQSLAEMAWLNEYTQIQGEMNGKTISCVEEKVRATRAYFNQQVLGKTLNRAQPYKHKVSNVILSAGGAKDAVFVRTLCEEVEKIGYQFWPINTLKGADSLDSAQQKKLADPRFTAAEGLKTKAELALDIGNSALKGMA